MRSLGNIPANTWLMGGIFTAVLLFFIGTVWFLAQNPTTTEQRIAQILEDPREFYGQEVALSGEIGELIAPRAFTVKSPVIVGGSLLVLSREPLQPVGGSGFDEFFLSEDDQVSIDGKVRVFNLREVEEELGVDLEDGAFLTWEGRPVVIADDISENQ